MADKIKVSGPEVLAYAEKHAVDLSAVQGTGSAGRVTIEDARNARQMPYVTPLVAKMANDESIDLRDIEGTGVGGRISRNDVLRAAGKLPAAVDEDQLLAEIRTDMAASQAFLNNHRRTDVSSRGPAFALNALADKVRAQADSSFQPTTPPPTLFAAGDLPNFTASGIPPEALLTVPWEARHALAAAPTQADAYAIQADCAANNDSSLEYSAHPGNADYAARVQQWAVDSISDDAIEAQFEAMYPGLLGPKL